MGITAFIGKVFIVIINILILMLSIAMVICGLIVVSGKDIYNSLLDTFRNHLEGVLREIGVNADTSNLTFTSVMLPLAYGVIALGVIMGILSLLGCIGGCCSCKILLIVYVTVMLLFFLVQVVVVAVIYADNSAFQGVIKPQLKKTLKRFSDIEGKEPETLVWNAIMNYQGCCGVDSYKDFHGLKHWPPDKINNKTVYLDTPIMCCKNKTADFSCAEKGKANPSNNWWKTGCYDKLIRLAVDNKFVIIVIGILMACQFAIIVITIWILCTVDNKII